ncbi:unnamed protein product [Arabis nemorensis]|uniref:Uncharacterized protein n=1 Tax=Arabis nemorensis TaxID=586526 RepID=A0A565C9T0_9BRAS|nr:unnamed protein product [Arabis nemorensis]
MTLAESTVSPSLFLLASRVFSTSPTTTILAPTQSRSLPTTTLAPTQSSLYSLAHRTLYSTVAAPMLSRSLSTATSLLYSIPSRTPYSTLTPTTASLYWSRTTLASTRQMIRFLFSAVTKRYIYSIIV